MADPSRVTQGVVLALVESSAPPRDTQSLSLATVEQGGKPRATQSAALGLGESTPRPRLTQAVALTLAVSAEPRVTQSLVQRLGTSTATPRLTQSAVLVARDHPQPTRATHALLKALAERDGYPRATQSLVKKLGRSVAYPRATQALVKKLGRSTATPRVTNSVALVLSRDQCQTEAQVDGELTFLMLKRRLYLLLGEEKDEPLYWTDAEMERAINDAYRRLARDTQAYEFIQTQNTADGTADYTLDNNTIKIQHVYIEDGTLDPVLDWEIDRGAVRRAGGSRVWGYTKQDNLGVTLLDTPTAIEELAVWTIGYADDMSLHCDTPLLPCWAQAAIAFGAASTLLGKYGEQRNEKLSAAYGAIYQDYAMLLKGHVAGRSGEATHGLR